LSEEAIRAARAAMNDAIALRDTAAIAALLLPSYHVVTARSQQRDGRDAAAASWRVMFERTSSHVATPEAIHVNEMWGMAEEHGRWEGSVATKEGPLELAGVYAAKWHLTAEGWRLQAEIFTPLTVRAAGER
jgi:ketosteroid isomerase-like protein